jgi:uncharacterized protein (DUF433 family)
MDLSREHIEIIQGEGGPKLSVEGHRIRVEDVVGRYRVRGMSLREILEESPTVTRADVYAAMAYYWDHQDELHRQCAEQKAWAEATWAEYRRQNLSKFQGAEQQFEEKWLQDAVMKQEAESSTPAGGRPGPSGPSDRSRWTSRASARRPGLPPPPALRASG